VVEVLVDNGIGHFRSGMTFVSPGALFGSIIEDVSHSIFHNWSLVELDCLEGYDITEKLGLNPEVCKVRLTDCDLYRNYEWKEFSIVAQSP
jgi:hypothetical protein